MRNLWLASGSLLWSLVASAQYEAPRRHAVVRTSHETKLDLRAAHNLFKFDLRDSGGRPSYRVVCFSGADAAGQDAPEFIYSGGLLCGLGPSGTPDEQILGLKSILGEYEGATSTRASFTPEAMVGACARYPDYGLTRTFLLRGFRLTLELSDVEVTPGYNGGSITASPDRHDYPVGHIKLKVSVMPDPSATTEYAAPSPYEDPRGDQKACGKPIKR